MIPELCIRSYAFKVAQVKAFVILESVSHLISGTGIVAGDIRGSIIGSSHSAGGWAGGCNDSNGHRSM
jgi:hypothetical protein